MTMRGVLKEPVRVSIRLWVAVSLVAVFWINNEAKIGKSGGEISVLRACWYDLCELVSFHSGPDAETAVVAGLLVVLLVAAAVVGWVMAAAIGTLRLLVRRVHEGHAAHTASGSKKEVTVE